MLKRLARWILRDEINQYNKYDAILKLKTYIDIDDTDQITYWTELARWADNKNGRRWAFERLNKLLNQLVLVTSTDSHMFYVIQGAIAEMNNFIQMPEVTLEKLSEVKKSLEKPKNVLENEDEEALSKSFQ